MGNCGAKNVKRDTQVKKPMMKSNNLKENQAPMHLTQNKQNCPSLVLQEKAIQKTPEKPKKVFPYFVPSIMSTSLSEQAMQVLTDLTGKGIVDELIQGKSVMEIIGEVVVMIEEFSDLVGIINELVGIISYEDKERIKEVKQIEDFVNQLKILGYAEGHEEFVQFIQKMKEHPSYSSFEQARELECKTIYLLVETFAAFQVVRNDCYSTERRHWWRPIKEEPELKEIEFGPLAQQNSNTYSMKNSKFIITNDYFNYYLDKFIALATEYQEYITIEQEAANQFEEDQMRKKEQEEEEQRNREIEEQRLEEEAKRREQEEKERIERELYEQEQERIKQEMYYNSLFEEEDEQANCRCIGDINNLQFHVKKQLIA